ncbi:MAG: MBL fold metallo-hydrolase [Thermoleophilia bacterium]|nr:MBL fold metallo-hydrolase [Thermoleophilia bacterium]
MTCRALLVASIVLACAVAIGGCDDDGSGASIVAPTVSASPVSTTSVAAPTTSASVAATMPPYAPVPATLPATVSTAVDPVQITVLFDNTADRPGVQTGWGFSCIVEGLEKTVLFDTGADGAVLLSNMDALGIAPEDVDVVVLSHEHRDHTGGLAGFVARNPDVTVYHPASFSTSAVASALKAGATLAPVEAAVSPCEGFTVTGPVGSPAESALVAETERGPVLIVGCAHAGVVEMVRAASDAVGRPITAVLGGFHLMSQSAGQVDRIVQELKELGVQRCGPAHCTGEAAIARITEGFGAGAVQMGVGSVVSF